MNVLTPKIRVFFCMVFCVFSCRIYAQSSYADTVLTDAGQCYAVVDNISYTGSLSGTLSYTLISGGVDVSPTNGSTTDASGNQFPIGVTVVSYYDDQSPVETHSIIVVPRIERPLASAIRYAASGTCDYTVVGTEFDPVIANNCVSTPEMTIDNLAGTKLPVGIDTVVVTSKVGSKVMQEESMIVTVKDTISPVIGKLLSLTAFLDGTGAVMLTPQDFIITASDNCIDSADLVYQIRGQSNYDSSVSFFCSDTAAMQPVHLKVTDRSGNSAVWTASVTVKDTISPVIGKLLSLTAFLDGTGAVTLTPQDFIITASDNCIDSADLVYQICRQGEIYASSVSFPCSDTAAMQTVHLKVTDRSGNSAVWTASVTVKDTIPPVVLCKENVVVRLDSNSGQYTLTPDDLFNSVSDNCTANSGLRMKLILNRNLVLLDSFTFNCTHVGDTIVTVLIRDIAGNISICEKTITIAYYEGRTPAPTVDFSSANGEICNNSAFTLHLGNDGFDGVTQWEWTTSPVAGVTGNVSSSAPQAGPYELQHTLRNNTNEHKSVTYVISARLYNQCLLTGAGIFREVTVNPTLVPVAIPNTNICNATHVYIPLRSDSKVSSHAQILFRWDAGSNPNVEGCIDGDGKPTGDTIDHLLRNTSSSSQDVVYSIEPYLRLNGYSCTSDSTTSFTVKVQPRPGFMMISNAASAICSGDTVSLTASMQNTLSDAVWSYSTDSQIPTGLTVNGTIASTPGVSKLRFDNANPDKLTATYIFDPKITITTSGQICTETNDSVAINITVNPIPVLSPTFSGNDSICYNEGTTLRLATPNRDISGIMKYHLDVNYDVSSVTNVSSSGIYEWQDEIDQTGLKNMDEQAQTVRYIFIPMIDISGKKCRGESDTVVAHIAPELKFDLQPSVYTGGWNINCNRENTGKINIRSLRGAWETFGYDYLWNTGASVDSVHQLKAGVYSVTVTNKVYGCHATKALTLKEPQKIAVVAVVTKPVCNGPTGKIELQVSGGTRDYKYRWDGPEYFVFEDSAATSLRAGNYYITIKDANACDTSFTVIMPAAGSSELFPNWNVSRYGKDEKENEYNISCHGAGDGIINPNINVQNIVIYTLWKGNQLVKTDTAPGATVFLFGSMKVENLSEGEYHLTVVDEAGCMYETAPLLIRQPPPVTFDTSVLIYPSGFEIDCYGSATGHIEVQNVAGGYGTRYGPYEYEWTSGNPVQQGSPIQTQLTAGLYGLKIRNKRSSGYCDVPLTFTLRQPPEIKVNATIPARDSFEITCHGQKTGSIEIDILGNYSEYQFLWTTPDGEVINPAARNQYNLPAGNYFLDVTYGTTGCVLRNQYLLRQPTAIEPNVVVQDVTCHGTASGAISLSPSGGIPGYRYRWQTPDFDIHISHPTWQNQTGMPAGIYWPVITDTAGCVKTLTVEIKEPVELKANIKTEDPTCTPGGDGSITLEPTGGTPGYSYLWSTGATGKDITGLSEGDYAVTITDNNNCTATAVARINTPGNLSVNAKVASDYNGYQVACYGGHSGKIELDIPNGRPPYACQYISDDGSMKDLDLQHAVAGNYRITVTDLFNCSGIADVLLGQPPKMQLTATTSDPTCAGSDDGSIRMTITGGVSPYSYNWSNMASDVSVAEHLRAGHYPVTVVDKNQCGIDTLFLLTQPEAIDIRFETEDAYCPEIPDGSIRSHVTGGVAPYAYKWQGISNSSPTLDEITGGQYVLEVTDRQNCTVTARVEVGYRSNTCLKIPNAFSPNADGANDYWEIRVGDPASTATPYTLGSIYPEVVVEVYSANWGMLLYRSQKGYPEPWDGKYNGKYLPVNSYVYVIRLRSDMKPIVGNVTIIR
ncbi:MAG: gliding motility-associated C-terminal domain-containing protein [Bacteroidales bacterium]|nr:gliding motility-associated C-terminal domain-containing protein [Bacteroidales bacterium]